MSASLAFAGLVVYGAAAALALFLAHRFVAPISRRLALVLALLPLLFTGPALLTGRVYAPIDILYDSLPFNAHRESLGIPPDRSPTLGDVVYQVLPWRAAVRRAYAERRLPLWDPSVLAGEPLLAIQQAAPLHPGTWLGLLLPFPQAWTFDMTLRILLALLFGFLFLRESGCGEAAALLGGLGWAFADWMVFHLGMPQNPVAAPFPLLLLGLRRLARAPDRANVGIALVALVLSATGGHPETLLFVATGGGAYFLFELVGHGRGHRGHSVLAAASAGVLALGLCAILLLPLRETLVSSGEYWNRVNWYAHRPRSVPASQVVHRLLPQVLPYAVGVAGRGRVEPGFVEPFSYSGALLLPLAAVGILGRRRERGFFVVLALAALAVCTKTPAADALAKLPLFDIALNERLVFLMVFSVCTLAAFGADRLFRGEGRMAFAVASVAVLSLLTILFIRARPVMAALEMSAGYARERFLFQVLPLAVGLVLLAWPRSRPRGLPLALVATFALTRAAEEGDRYPTLPARTFYPPLAILEKIPRALPFRMTAVRGEFFPNAAAVYALEDVRGYVALSLGHLIDTFPLWTIAQPVWFNRVDDPAAPFLSFLNVRWMLMRVDAAVPAGWPVLAESDGMRLVENPAVLPRAFAPMGYWTVALPARRLAVLTSIRDFHEAGVVDEPGEERWIDNGRAEVRITRYGAQALELDVDAQGETLIGTSIPAWPGWTARVDDRMVPTIAYNHAFLGFRVPAGRHRVGIRYLPASFVRGAAITLLTAVLILGVLLNGLRARTPPRGRRAR